MVYDPLAGIRAKVAIEAGEAMLGAGLPLLATYWDFRGEDGPGWVLYAVLTQARKPLEFYATLGDLERTGKLPEGLESGDIHNMTYPDPKADALVRYAQAGRKRLVALKSSVVDGIFFEEAILG